MNDKTLEELRYYFNGYGNRHDEAILKLIDQNKRYRELLEDINGSFEKYMTMRISESDLIDDIDSFQTKIYKALESESE